MKRKSTQEKTPMDVNGPIGDWPSKQSVRRAMLAYFFASIIAFLCAVLTAQTARKAHKIAQISSTHAAEATKARNWNAGLSAFASLVSIFCVYVTISAYQTDKKKRAELMKKSLES